MQINNALSPVSSQKGELNKIAEGVFNPKNSKDTFISLLDLFKCIEMAEEQDPEGELKEEAQSLLDQSFNKDEETELVGLLLSLQGYFSISKDANFAGIADKTDTESILTEDNSSDNISGKIPSEFLDSISKETDFNKYKILIAKLLDELSGKIIEQPTNMVNSVQSNKINHHLQLLINSNNNEISEDITGEESILSLQETKPHNASRDKGLTLPKSELISQINIVNKSNDQHNSPQKLKEFSTSSVDNQESNVLFQNSIEKPTYIPNIIQPKLDFEILRNQIIQEIQKNIVVEKKDIKEFDIQLHPAELGKIQINLKWQDGQIHLHLKASELATEASIQQNLPDLKQKLESMGIPCGSLQMGNESNKNSNWQNSRQQRQIKVPTLNKTGKELPDQIVSKASVYDKEHKINFMA